MIEYIFIILLVGLAVLLAVKHFIKILKGDSSCGSSCTSCHMTCSSKELRDKIKTEKLDSTDQASTQNNDDGNQQD